MRLDANAPNPGVPAGEQTRGKQSSALVTVTGAAAQAGRLRVAYLAMRRTGTRCDILVRVSRGSDPADRVRIASCG